jgi:L-asparagine transporter-like permease
MTWLIDAVTKIWNSVTGFIESAMETAKRVAQIARQIAEAPVKFLQWFQVFPPWMTVMLVASLALIIIFAVLKVAGFGGDRD